jgi:hypothetical protein
MIYRYCITTQHGPFEWTIFKRYRHFNDLHKALVQFVEAETKRSMSELEKYVLNRISKRYIHLFCISIMKKDLKIISFFLTIIAGRYREMNL